MLPENPSHKKSLTIEHSRVTRCDVALNAIPAEAPLAYLRLLDTPQMLSPFPVAVFDAACATVMERLQRRHRRRTRDAALMLAAVGAAGQQMLADPSSGGLSRGASPSPSGQLDC